MTTAEATVTTTTVAEIPVHLTPFVGRERELGALIPLLEQARLLTLTGAGGSGKTRLAIELALRATAGKEIRLTWVDLAPLAGGTMVAEQVGLALRAHDGQGTSLIEAIVASLRETPTFLVLDNCEHVVDEAAAFVEQAMRACQSVRVLATSREALGVPGETAWLVPPLATEEATALFFDRAKAANPGFRPAEGKSVETICKRLDGIPLAIELAAARARVLSAEQIAERLDDAFRLLTSGNRTAIPRQRTLRGTMDWSHDLLNARERALLRRLSVFSGSFTLDSAETVCCGEPLASEDILDGVAALVDKSLVVMEPGDDEATYRMLETVRQYALEKLHEANEGDATRQAHAEYFVAFAEEAEPHLFGGAGEMDWIERVRSASGNLRAAALWCEHDSEHSAMALRIYVAINWYSFATGQLGDARQRLTTALERAGDIDPLLRGRALLALAHLVLWQGDHTAVGPYADQSLELLTRANPIDHASALSLKAASLLFGGDPVAAGFVAEEALALARIVPPHCIQPFVLYWRGWAATSRGDHELARESLEEAIAIGRRIRHRPGIGHALALLGRLAAARGDFDEALIHFSEGLEIHNEIDDQWGMTIGFEGLVPVFMHLGQPRRSARLLGVTDTLRDRMSARLSPAQVEQRAALMPQLEALLGDSLDALVAEGRTMPLVDAVHMAARSEQFQTSTFRVPMALLPPEPVQEAVDRLRVDVLGPLEVRIGDRVVPSTAWGSARPRELLVMLLMQPDGCTKEQIGLAFWPEASTTQLRNNFHVTLHRLRKALGHPEWITLAQERYRIDPASVASFDVTNFEQQARAALEKARSGDDAITALERATALYRGDFMDGEAAGDWHIPHRDRLLRLYIEMLMALGEAHTRQQRYAKAAEAYRRVLVRDDLHEDAVRALMQSLERGGERSSALRLYERFADRLKQELRAKPSATTVALHRELSRGEGVAS